MVRTVQRIPCKVWRGSMLLVLSKLKSLCLFCSIHSEAFGLYSRSWALQNYGSGRIWLVYIQDSIEMSKAITMHHRMYHTLSALSRCPLEQIAS
jgi:hypothetical protein